MSVSVEYSDGSTSSVGYNISGATLIGDVQNINRSNTYAYNYESGPLSGGFRMALSLTEAIAAGISVFQPSDWASYVQSLEGSSATETQLAFAWTGENSSSNTASWIRGLVVQQTRSML